ncbi:hypothetical protein [Ornithinimicrobium kibberense]|uniref:hypothetical protein n=1 Tax=Ornithinimicrobium kibberense TaxID=282060 RepID=UPI00361A40D3
MARCVNGPTSSGRSRAGCPRGWDSPQSRVSEEEPQRCSRRKDPPPDRRSVGLLRSGRARTAGRRIPVLDGCASCYTHAPLGGPLDGGRGVARGTPRVSATNRPAADQRVCHTRCWVVAPSM